MSKRRLELQELLEKVPGLAYDKTLEGKAVYFQPPSTVFMTYPCIRYSLEDINVRFAGNLPYTLYDRYSLIVIDPDPDSTIRDEVAKLPMCSFDRSYTTNNLNHYVFTIYF